MINGSFQLAVGKTIYIRKGVDSNVVQNILVSFMLLCRFKSFAHPEADKLVVTSHTLMVFECKNLDQLISTPLHHVLK